MKKKIMLITLIVLGTLAFAFLFGKTNLSYRFKNEVKELFAQSKPIAGNTFNYKQLEGLPDPIQRYFKKKARQTEAALVAIAYYLDIIGTEIAQPQRIITSAQYIP
jgi:hypothetical protein